MKLSSRNSIVVLTFVSLFMTIPCFLIAQEKIKVSAFGEYSSSDLSQNEILQRAIEKAKENALREAGITESIESSSLYYVIENQENYEDYYNKISTIETNAEIIVDSIYPEEKRINSFNQTQIKVQIDATVYLHDEKKDPAFKFNIKGIKDVYYENETLNFSFFPNKEGYLKIFVLAKDDAFLLYPYENNDAKYLSDNPDSLFLAGTKVDFPIHPAYKPGYSLQLENGQKSETNIILFVYLKENWLFDKTVFSKNQIEKWLYSWPLNQRHYQLKCIEIKKS